MNKIKITRMKEWKKNVWNIEAANDCIDTDNDDDDGQYNDDDEIIPNGIFSIHTYVTYTQFDCKINEMATAYET